MKRNILLLSLVIISLSCNKYLSTSERKDLKRLYVSEFKMTYFKALLEIAYNNSESIKTIMGIDRSSFTEPILSMEDIQMIKAFTTATNDQMVQDSINSYSSRAEGAQGKAVFGYALEKYNSKWLDSLANERYKIYEKKEIEFRKYLRRKD